jgi:predicted Fe-Mo cluster-binding NifX family protein
MKTLITSKEDNDNALFDMRFGRGAYFCIYDDQTKEVDFIKNEYVDAHGGAGQKASEKSIELGVSKVISGDFGPKAKNLLKRFSIQMVIIEYGNKKIKDIIRMLEKGNN